MSWALPRPASLRAKLFLLLIGPFLVALGAGLGGFAGGASTAEGLVEHERWLNEVFQDLMLRAGEVSDEVLSAATSGRPSPPGRGALKERVEGSAILGPGLGFVSWTGTPAEPPVRFDSPDWPRWSVRLDGLRTRLLVRSGPDEQGRLALVTFMVDSMLADHRFSDLLPSALLHSVQLDVTFKDTELWLAGDPVDLDEVPGPLGSGPNTRTLWLASPDGQILAAAALSPLHSGLRDAQVRRSGRAWAALLLVALMVVVVPWSRYTHSAPSLGIVLAALIAARLLLLWQQVPGRLLPRDLGTASLYGSTAFGGLLESPADLCLTGLVVFLVCIALRRFCTALASSHRRTAFIVSSLAGLGATLAAAGMTASLAWNSRTSLLERPAPFEWDGRLLLWVGLLLVLIGAAELWAQAGGLLRRASFTGPPRRIQVALNLLVLAAATSIGLQQLMERVALEQLASEFEPQILGQTARRTMTLASAMGQIEDSVLSHDPDDPRVDFKPEAMAYRYWVDGELFHSGYRSSLDFYTPEGDLISHFGFDLPRLAEDIRLEPPGEGSEKPARKLVSETFERAASVHQRLLHAEFPVIRQGEALGVIVGHVLDEPDNLPFLPWYQPYLAALGPGQPSPGAEFGGNLEYVLYDEYGKVELTTLQQPPAESGVLKGAAEHGDVVRIRAGEDRYIGVALDEDGERLHLLLLPVQGFQERLAAIVRLALLGLLLLVVLTAVSSLPQARALAGLAVGLRRSFYRKLLAALLLASVVPLIGLALFLRGYIERRADAMLVSSATQFVSAAKRVVEDYSAVQADTQGAQLTDWTLYWLRSVVGQEIHVYENGLLLATSKRELFKSGLLLPRLDGEVQQRLVDEGLPYLVRRMELGLGTIPVAYAAVRAREGELADRVVAVPLVLEQRQIAEATARVAEMILLATVALAGLLAVAAATLARTVARPVRDLVRATSRYAEGDYTSRLKPRTHDEVAELVQSFNTMGAALQQQRRDLERQRDYMETLLHHDTTGVISIDAQGRIVTVNPSAAVLLGRKDRLHLVGADLGQVLADGEGLRPLAEALEARRGPTSSREVDLSQNGYRRRYQVVSVDLRGRSGTDVGTLFLLDDVTDLMRSNQLAAWAEMATVIAHEIKNPLTPIQLSSEHLRRVLHDRKILPAPEVEACLDTIVNQVRALYEIAGEFSAYARLPALALEPQDPATFLRQALEPYRVAPPDGVSLVEEYREAPAVALDRRVLGRAIVNLVENALQAMPDGGTLSVRLAPDATRKEAVMTVEDTGSGLDPAVRQRLFEPYFSTKSSGTGLGLAIVRRAVEGHHGRIEVESEAGRGTRFDIRLPYTSGDGATGSQGGERADPAPGD